MKTITSFIISTIFCTTVLLGQQSAILDFFDTYRNNEDFTQVNISPKMFEMFAQMSENEDDETLEMIRSLSGLQILTTEVEPRKYYKEFLAKVSIANYEELMTIKDESADVKFLVKEAQGNIVKELLLLIGDDENFVMMNFAGQIQLDKIGKLAENINFSGSEHLKQLNKK